MLAIGARRATPADIGVILELTQRGIAEMGTSRGGALWTVREAPVAGERPTVEALVAAPDTLVLVGEIDDVPVAYAVARLETLRDGSLLGHLTDLYVDPEAREIGVGEALIGDIVDWCEAQGCRGIDSLVLPGLRSSKNFFETWGFVARAIVVHRPLRTSESPDEPAP